MKFALFASGNGSNVQAIINAVKAGNLDAELVCLVTDKKDAYVLERVKDLGMATLIASPKDYETRNQWEEAIAEFVKSHQADYLVLAGFMRILGRVLLEAFPDRIINIHPSYLPAFPGAHGILDAYQAGVEETGVTVFVVDQGIDTGRILDQVKIPVDPKWSLEELEEAVHKVEHDLYPRVLQDLAQKQE